MAHLRARQIRSPERKCVGSAARKAKDSIEIVLREDLRNRRLVPSGAHFVSMVSGGERQ